MIDYNVNRGFRLLHIHGMLNKGELVSKTSLANQFNVTEKTIQRDIDDLRTYFADTHVGTSEVSIKYDRVRGGYFLVKMEREWLTNEEVLAVSKILLESRAFCKEELDGLISKLLMQITPNDQRQVEDIIRNEQFYYVPPRHNKKLLDMLWDLSGSIVRNEIIKISYIRMNGMAREHEIKPVAIVFSEYYFYLVAFMADGRIAYPTVFRVDRLSKTTRTGAKFHTPYCDKFNDGEFRNRVQFMHPGELQTVTFTYSGPSVEAVLDRLPTANILSEEDGVYTIKVEVYGNGIDMWLRSQGAFVKIMKDDQ